MRAKRLPRYAEAAQMHDIMAFAGGRNHLLVECLWMTGGRISEVLQLRKSDIGKRWLRLPNLKQRGPAEKIVFIGDQAFLSRLREYAARLKGDGLLFSGRNGGPLSRMQAWRIYTRASREAGVFLRHSADGDLTPAWPHTARHSYAVHLLTHGVPITAVRDQLGHASLSSTEVYTSLADPAKEKAIAGVKF